MSFKPYAHVCCGVLSLVFATIPPAIAGGLPAPWGPACPAPLAPAAAPVEWLDAAHYLDRQDGVLHKIDARTGDAAPVYDHEKLRAALEDHSAFGSRDARRAAQRPTQLTGDYAAALLVHKDRCFVYRFDEGQLREVAGADPSRRLSTLSPLGHYVAFVSGNNLYAADVRRAQTNQLTTDGGELVLNGILDWVYQEEVYTRGQWRSYWWSPDEQYVAFVQLTEHDVPQYPLLDHRTAHPKQDHVRYPKAGDPNPKARIGFVRPDGGGIVWADLSRYDPADLIICECGWSPDGKLFCPVQNRIATWLELVEADPATGATRVLVREESPAWVRDFGRPHWLPDGSFLWRSARDGWAHLYHYTRDGALIARLTAGEFEVRKIHGLDDQQRVYFSATCDSPVAVNAYRVPLASGPIERLTEPGYHHRTDFSADCSLFFDDFSALKTPPRRHVRDRDGELVRVVSEEGAGWLSEDDLARTALLRIDAGNGHLLNAILIRPPNMAPDKKYPVMMHVYGGPSMPTVQDSWRGWHMSMYSLARRGYMIWMVDPYSASGEGDISAWHCYKRLGVTELEDIEASLRWLGENEQADLERVAIAGHSYGGFVVLFALTHSRMFKIGVAAAGVSDWRHYDTIYTERYMSTPVLNPDGYDRASALKAAGDLHGKLLIAHGVLDDNVHVTNALQMIDALQQAGRDFDLMLYPRDDHGLYRNGGHWERLQTRFVEENL